MKQLFAIFSRIRHRHREWREAVAFSKRYHRDSRARMKELDEKGEGWKGLEESVSLMGFKAGERPTIVSVAGVRFDKH
jgi:hypothetical protein